MTATYAASVARHLATFIGGYLAARGLASQEEVQQVTATLVTLAGIAWSIKQKHAAAKVVAAQAAALAAQPASPAP